MDIPKKLFYPEQKKINIYFILDSNNIKLNRKFLGGSDGSLFVEIDSKAFESLNVFNLMLNIKI